ncbi:MAG: Coenzyme F420 hydrogenase/dehydrogenase, beta subunit C-terminal domain, partial [Phocaeicola sp.]|nr:Coenzyme F420 hydrogenase/dehydrogenase, beta subunit C-terminal domain [Phocaeicola sp.]
MIDIGKKEQCCGCNVCGDICPKNAISYKYDNEGFLYPHIDNTKCVDCSLCEQVCPMISKVNNLGRSNKPKVYAAYSKNEMIRLDSTSGGIHSVLALQMYDRKSYVSGAVYNEDFSVSHIVSDNKNLLPKIRSSKYIQSDSRGIYIQIKKLLDNNKKVFFCGTPCQVQALYKFLKKDYDDLTTCDFVCRGVNSPKVFHSYIDMLERQYKSKVKEIKFKAKKWGWHNFSMRIDFENGVKY